MSITRFLVFAFLSLTISAQAQIQIGTIKGVVTDPAGSVVAAAKVLLTSPLTGEQVEAVTDGAGGQFHSARAARQPGAPASGTDRDGSRDGDRKQRTGSRPRS